MVKVKNSSVMKATGDSNSTESPETSGMQIMTHSTYVNQLDWIKILNPSVDDLESLIESIADLGRSKKKLFISDSRSIRVPEFGFES